MQYDMITVGDIKLDTFVVIPDASVSCSLKKDECLLCLPYAQKIPIDIVDSQIAGSAPNVAVGLSRMKFKTGVVSVMGKDGTRQMAMEVLKRENVDTRFVRISPGVESSYSVVLNYKGDKTILASHAMRKYRLPIVTKPRWLYVSELGDGYEQLFRDAARYVKKNGVTLGFNPGVVQIREWKQELFQLIHETFVLFVNVEEAQTLMKEKSRDPRKLSTALFQLGPEYVVMTDGKAGAYAFDGHDLYFCPVFPTKVVESTGAGDAFATGFMGALMSGETEDTALKWGAVNAASVVSFVGPQKGLLSTHEIKKRLKASPKFRTKKR